MRHSPAPIVLDDPDVSDAQRALFAALSSVGGRPRSFSPPALAGRDADDRGAPRRRRTAQRLGSSARATARAASAARRWAVDGLSALRSTRRRRRPDCYAVDGGCSMAAPRALRWATRANRVHVFHVGKTGGTALNHVLVEHADVARYRPVFGDTSSRSRTCLTASASCFSSATRSPGSSARSTARLREGRPRYHYPWREEERVAFAIFKTPDQLATALSSADRGGRVRKRKRRCMASATSTLPTRSGSATRSAFRRTAARCVLHRPAGTAGRQTSRS